MLKKKTHAWGKFFNFTMVSRDYPFRQRTEYLAIEALYVKIATYFITSLLFVLVHVLISVINFLSLSTLIFMIKVKGMEGVKTRTKSICWLKIILHNNTKSRHFKKASAPETSCLILRGFLRAILHLVLLQN